MVCQINRKGRTLVSALAELKSHYLSWHCCEERRPTGMSQVTALSSHFKPTLIFMAAPFKSFTLALIQLGRVTANKQENLKHAREMIVKAANGNLKRPDLV